MDKTTIGARIREQRKLLGMTQEQFAEKAHITGAYLSEIERGHKLPSITTLIHIVNGLEISADILLRDTVRAAKPYALNEFMDKIQNLTPEQLKLMNNISEVLCNHFQSQIKD